MLQRRVVFPRKNEVDIAIEELPRLKEGEVRIATICSAISPGSEGLVLKGGVDDRHALDSTLDLGQDRLTFPVSYGYASVGRVVELGPESPASLLGQRVFTFAPHSDIHSQSVENCYLLPQDLEADAACMLPNLETAVSLIMDAAPVLGERGAIVGLGIVGQLVAMIFDYEFPHMEIIGVEPTPLRQELAQKRLTTCGKPEEILEQYRAECDFVIECSGQLQALPSAIELTRNEGRVIIGSWYGDQSSAIALNTHFHRARIQLISSQVSEIRGNLAGRFTKDRRWKYCLELATKLPIASLITHQFALSEVRSAYDFAIQRKQDALQVLIQYPKEEKDVSSFRQ